MSDIGHNNPPAAATLFAEEIESLRTRAYDMASEGVTEDNAGAASDLVKLAGKLSRDIDAKRKEEKEPHLQAGKAVDAIYTPLRDEAKGCANGLKSELEAFLREQRRIAEEKRLEAERIAKAKAERARKLAEDAVLGDHAQEQADDAAQAARAAAAQQKAAQNVKGSDGFRASSFRTTRKAEITDYAKALDYYSTRDEVKDLIQKLANADVRSGAPLDLPFLKVVGVETLV